MLLPSNRTDCRRSLRTIWFTRLRAKWGLRQRRRHSAREQFSRVVEDHGLSKAKMSSELIKRVSRSELSLFCIWPRAIMRAIDYFDKSANLYPDRTAIVDGERSYSYSEVRDFSERIARRCGRAGWSGKSGRRFTRTIIPRFCSACWGFAGGAAWVPINFRNAADANVEFLNYSKTTWFSIQPLSGAGG